MPQHGRVVAEGAAAAVLQAELTPIVTVGSTATLVVRLVRADATAGQDADQHVAGWTDRIVADGPVTVTVVPRGLRFLVGGRRSRQVRLSATATAEARFTMIAVDRGPAEVVVLVRGEGELPLATVRLTSEVVVSDDHDQAGLARASTRITAADPLITCRPTLRVDEELARGRSILHVALCAGADTHRFRIRLADKAALVRDVRAALARAKEAGAELPADRRADAVEHALRDVGARLADRLLDRRARDLLWAHRTGLEGLVLQTTGETDLPWELLVVRRPGASPTDADPFLGQYGLTRWLYDAAPPSAVRLSTTPDAGTKRPSTAIASASVVALGAGVDGAVAGGAAAAMRNGAGVVVECGGSGGRSVLSETFLATFSTELADGSPVDRASRVAREAARAAGDACALAYAVYGHPDARAQAA